jgi:glutamate 5-kinase
MIERMVIKIGTLVITGESGRVDRARMSNLVGQVARVHDRGISVGMVSSGAIASGMERIGIEERPSDLETLQAVAAVGQGALMQMYAEQFATRGITAGQMLLSRHDLTHRQHYLNARHTIERLFSMGVVPIINENDTVATEEITFGDNDTLAALVASMAGVDLLVLLTDTAGLHTADPFISDGASLLEEVEHITGEIESLAGEPSSVLGSGGMISKVRAARVAVMSGVDTVIADGRAPDTIEILASGGRKGTFFPAKERVSSKKQWIGFARKVCGRIVVDRGAVVAITSGNKSLLPAGVLAVEGDFMVGDCVEIADSEGRVIGRGLANYGTAEAERIKGLRTDRIGEVLGGPAEVMVHKDDMVVLGEEEGE